MASASSGQRIWTPSGGRAASVGSVTCTRSGSISTVAVVSTVSDTSLNPVQSPENRDMAQPWRPRSRNSWTPAGCRMGIMASMRANSLWCAEVEDLQVWSSPDSTSTPPWGEVPAVLPCLSAVAGAVDARALGVEHGEDAVDGGVVEEMGLLRAPDGGRREVLVEAGVEVDGVLFREAPGAPQCHVERAQRRAAIAGDEGGGVEPGGGVACMLQHGQAHQRMGARHQDAALFEGVAVVEGDVGKRHARSREVVTGRLGELGGWGEGCINLSVYVETRSKTQDKQYAVDD